MDRRPSERVCLTSLEDGLFIDNIVTYCSAKDLLSLALTTKQFGWKNFTGRGSLIEKAARLMVLFGETELTRQARLSLNKTQTGPFLELLHKVEKLQAPLLFQLGHPIPVYLSHETDKDDLERIEKHFPMFDIALTMHYENCTGNEVRTKSPTVFEKKVDLIQFENLTGEKVRPQSPTALEKRIDREDITHSLFFDHATVCGSGLVDAEKSAIANYVMSSGRHYATFQIKNCPRIGIVRPFRNIDSKDSVLQFDGFPSSVDPDHWEKILAGVNPSWREAHVVEYDCIDGLCTWESWCIWDRQYGSMEDLEWDGMESIGDGDTLGMLLDLEAGELTLYKNGRRLGVMKDGLDGEYCWYCVVNPGDVVKMKRETPPLA
mmetsp:Transcript_1606/g.2207  ORF Transcript_1606/g.2207 Transcript_1606/m.2207 type:complete len:376 (-) Transcript_1606:135-1262(-)